MNDWSPMQITKVVLGSIIGSTVIYLLWRIAEQTK